MRRPAEFLNNITMYRLVLYVLISINSSSIFFSALGLLPYSPLNIFLSTAILVLLSMLFNDIFSRLLQAFINIESTVITALILSLIVGPFNPINNFPMLALVSFFAVASKYLVTLQKRHIFNPAAFAVTVAAIITTGGASWWVGNIYLLPIAILGGALVVSKTRRTPMVIVFLLVYLVLSMAAGSNPAMLLIYSPIVFFATIMLTEPLTSPVGSIDQVYYAVLVSIFLYTLQQYTDLTFSLELSLLAGNLFSYVSRSPVRVDLSLKSKKKIAKNTYEFTFKPSRSINFKSGQYMEWTLPHTKMDKRGVRRYFTISSSPKEHDIRIGIKIPEKASTFKESLLDLKKGDKIVAMDVAGDFTLPKEMGKKLAFIAGGIGVTPFVSMLRWMIDNQEKRDIVLIYTVSIKDEVAYEKLFKQARKYGIKTKLLITEDEGYLNSKKIKETVPDFGDRYFYVSGPQLMVGNIEKLLKDMGVRRVKKDFFPGYPERK